MQRIKWVLCAAAAMDLAAKAGGQPAPPPTAEARAALP